MRPPEPALYFGRTTHVRLTPFRRRFSYRVYQVLLDIDRLEATSRDLSLLRVDRPGLMSFYRRDHGDGRGDLRAWAESAFASGGITLDGGAIRLLCFPRVLGYVFNPLSIFFGYGPEGAVRGVIYEVRNTFGEKHVYVARVDGQSRHVAPKRFHVSPLLDIEGAYRFRITEPGNGFALSIENATEGSAQHFASLIAKREPLTDASLLKAFAAIPFLTLQVILGIHWQALLIFLRGVKYRRKPIPVAPALTVGTPAQCSDIGPLKVTS